MSSDVTGRAKGNVAAAPEPVPGQAGLQGPGTDADQAAEPDSGARPADSQLADGEDPWFSPGPKAPDAGAMPEPLEANGSSGDGHTGDGHTGDSHAGDSSEAGFDPGSDTAQWFLRTGRAGLLPDAMTETWDEPESESNEAAQQAAARAQTAGAPPWAGEMPGSVASMPPPWETGPWPAPGEQRAPRTGGRRQFDSQAAGRGQAAASAPDAPAGLPAGLVLAAAVVPLVVPGLIAGVLGLRRARAAGSSQLASWAALALSVIWALVIVLVFAAGSGGQASACASYPASVRHAYTSAVTDLARTKVGQTQAADIRQAATLANNAAAAAAGQNSVRIALAQMANDLEQAGADVTAHRQVPATLLQALASDGTALSDACPGH